MAKVLKIRKKPVEELTGRGTGKAQSRGKQKHERSLTKRFKGRTTDMGVAEYQNYSLEQNRKRRLTDEQLALEWKKEFPNARADYTAETVNSVRGAYNRGAHPPQEGPPKVPVPQFDRDGTALPAWGSKAEARREAAAEVAASTRKSAVAAKKVVKRAVR